MSNGDYLVVEWSAMVTFLLRRESSEHTCVGETLGETLGETMMDPDG